MRKSALRFLVALALFGGAGIANASIIYDLNRTIGAGSAVGFIETDGTLGFLSSANITNWELTLTSANLSGGSPRTIDFATSINTAVQGPGGLLANPDALVFNFSTPSNFFLQGAFPNASFWGLGVANICNFGGPPLA